MVMAKETLTREGKFKRLVYLLQEPAPHVIGHLELMWHSAWAALDPRFRDPIDVEIAAEWDGAPGAFVEACLEARFIDHTPGLGYRVHGFWNHAPMSVKQRAARAGIDWKAEQAKEKNDNRAVTDQQPPDNHPVTGRQPVGDLPDPTRPDPTRPDPREGSRTRGTVARKPPELDEVTAYADEYMTSKGITGPNPAERFYNHFSSNGWKVSGRSPMKSWKAAIRNWILRDLDSGRLSKTEEQHDDEWVLDIYRRSDLEKFGDDPDPDHPWPVYLDFASDFTTDNGPRTAPTFDEWRNGRETE